MPTATALPTAALTIVAQLHRRPMGTQLFDGFAASLELETELETATEKETKASLRAQSDA